MAEIATPKDSTWQPTSWQKKQAKQQPTYQDPKALEDVLTAIKGYPPLVFAGEVDRLAEKLAKASRGEQFLLQGGDCAESFRDCNDKAITRKLKIMLQMSVVLSYGARKPVIRVGRIAGQYAKPRSQDMEEVGGQKIPVFRGENINSYEPTSKARMADPTRLLESYHSSAMTLNYIRALTKGGFADLHYPGHWNLDFVTRSNQRQQYEKIVENISDAIAFMESLGSKEEKLNWVEYYTSHEGLLLPFEQSQTRYVPEYDGYYNLGAHMLWIGDRTRQIDGAHVEYFRGIKNPVGLKVGPSASPKEIVDIVKVLNPKNKMGRVTLITRFGANKAKTAIKPYIEAIKSEKLQVVFSVDPMHGNVIKTEDGVKTRNFDDILKELKDTALAHKEEGSILGGVHFELTGDNVTECIGGAAGVTARDLENHYESYCDPRLNYSQSLEMAFLISSMLAQKG